MSTQSLLEGFSCGSHGSLSVSCSELDGQLAFDDRNEIVRFGRGPCEHHHLPFVVQDELGEIPGNHLAGLGLRVIELTVPPQKLINRVRIYPIHIYFLEHREVHIKLLLNELLDFFWGPFFLREELVAGESQDLQPSLPILLVETHQLQVVVRGEASLAGHIHHDNALGSPPVLPQAELVPVDIHHRVIEE